MLDIKLLHVSTTYNVQSTVDSQRTVALTLPSPISLLSIFIWSYQIVLQDFPQAYPINYGASLSYTHPYLGYAGPQAMQALRLCRPSLSAMPT